MKLIENGLVPIYESDGRQTINARELHERLDSKQDFTNWIENRIEKYGFVLDTDFSISLLESTGGRPRKEYALTVDVGKELAMLEGNEKGRQIRRYFIEVEKRAIKPATQLEVLQQAITVMVQQEQRITQLENRTQAIKDAILTKPENWRSEMNSKLNKAAIAAGGKTMFAELRNQSYEELERRAGANLDIRLHNRRSAASMAGEKKSVINTLNYMDVIEADKRLKEIYTTIVTEISIKYAA
jgi:anti-repressor protein